MTKIEAYYTSFDAFFTSFEETFYGEDDTDCWDKIRSFEDSMAYDIPGGSIADFYNVQYRETVL